MDPYWNQQSPEPSRRSPVLLALFLTLVSGCKSVQEVNRTRHPDTLVHLNTWGAFSEGDYAPHWTVEQIRLMGDHGLGTFEGLDGEMIIHSGRVYRAALDGSISEMAPTSGVPYAAVTWLNGDRYYDIEDMSKTLFLRGIELRRGTDQYPIAIEGNLLFDWIVTRSVPAQPQPYPDLPTALAGQQVQTNSLIEGTLIGFYMPEYMDQFHPPGFHFHFLSADHQRGGHVLDFHVRQGRVTLDPSPELYLLVPTNQPTFHFQPLGVPEAKPQKPRPLAPLLQRER